MKEYIIGLAAVTLVCGLITSLTGGGGSTEGLRTVCGICVVAVIVLPAASFIGSGGLDADNVAQLFDVDGAEKHYDEIYNSYFAQAEIKNAEERLKNEIIQELGVKGDGFDIGIIIDDDSGEKFIERVEVIIYSEGMAIDPHSVEKYITSRLECSCKIIYDV